MPRAAPPEDDEDAEVEPVPFWRRPRVMVLGAIAAVFLLFIFTRGKLVAKPDEDSKNDAYIGVVVPYQPAKADPPPPAPSPFKAAQQPQPPAAPQPAPPVATPPPATSPPPAPNISPPTPNISPPTPGGAPKPTRPVMLSYVVPHTNGPAPVSPPADPPQTGLDFKASTIPGAKASAAIDQTYLLMPGLLPVVLDTAISSDVPVGNFIGHLPGPVYSPKGVVLMEAGTQIIGKYEGLAPGGNRLQAVSTFAITPQGIFVPITDNASDDLGRTGWDGSVNHRYAERFGAAILLTLSQSALQIIQAKVSQGGDTYLNLGSGGGGGNSGIGGVAQQILQSTINLPPIFEKHQGETIAILLSAPTDFSASYRIRQAAQ